MRHCHKILCISYKDHVTDEEVCSKIQQAIEPHKDQTFLQGTVKGGRRQGRQKKSLEDNIREWTGLEFAKSQRAVENREKWGKLVVVYGAPMILAVKG